jgi:uncharacterized protein (DUF1697 family)
MALVVFLRGVNVGGHRTLRPARLAADLRHLGAVNIGATGVLVIRRPIGRGQLRLEIARRLPFPAEIAICHSREIIWLLSHDVFKGYPVRRDLVRFVSILSRCPRSKPSLPLTLPDRGMWLLKILSRDGRFVVGIYRRRMTVIGYLGKMDRLFGVPVTTRSWNTVVAIGRALEGGEGSTAAKYPVSQLR